MKMQNNSKLRKALSLFLAMTLFLGCLAIVQAFPADIADQPFEKDAEFLLTLGIMEPNTIENFSPEVTITRSEMAVLAVKMMNLAIGEFSGDTGYQDVPPNYYAAAEIQAISALGIMAGRGDGNFYPEEFITYGDALAICARILGYKELADNTPGEYPYNYYIMARDLGLTSGLNINLMENINRGNLSILIRNTLETELYQVMSVANGMVSKTVKEGETLLSEYHRIFKAEGQIMGNEVSFLNSSANLPEGKIQIGSLILNAGESGISDMLGRYVEAYYLKEEETVIFFEEVVNKLPLKVDADDIVSYSGSTLTYEQDGKEYRFTVPASLYVIYNKKAATRFSAELLTPAEGSLEFVDGDKDGQYDVVFVESYQNYIVDRLNTVEEIVLFTDGTRIDCGQSGADVILKDAAGEKQSFAVLKPGDVVTRFSSDDGSYTEIYRSEKVFSGTITAIYEEDGRISLTIDNGEENPSFSYTDKGFKARYPGIAVGSYGTFTTNIYGEVVGYSVQSADSIQLGYLIAGRQEDTLSEIYQVKIFSEKGEMMIRDLHDKVEMDGVRDTAAETFKKLYDAGGFKNQLIRFKMNEKGSITYIDTANGKAANDPEGDERLIKINQGTSQKYYSGQMVFEGTTFLQADTVIFSVPADPATAQDEDFAILTPADLGNGSPYTYYAYNEDYKQISASSLVIESEMGNNVQFAQYELLCYISKITTAVNDKGDVIHKVYYLKGGVASEARTVDDKLFKDRSVGDAMMIKLNVNNEIFAYRLYFDGKEKKLKKYNETTGEYDDATNPNMSDYNGQCRTIYGNVAYTKGDMVAIVNGDVTQITDPVAVNDYANEIHRLPRNLYLFDTEKNTVRKAASAEIVDYYTDSKNYCKMFYYQIYSLDYDAMIVI